jgi:hypothetical protein
VRLACDHCDRESYATFAKHCHRMYLKLLSASEDTLSRRSVHLQSLARKNLHWALVADYGNFFSCVIHKVNSGDKTRLMIMMILSINEFQFFFLILFFTYFKTCLNLFGKIKRHNKAYLKVVPPISIYGYLFFVRCFQNLN